MRRFRELVRVAAAGLMARKVRTLLIMLGPILGVAAIVAAIGINESSKGYLKAKLQELGTDLIVANAQDSIGGFGQNPRIPAEAVVRVSRLPDVISVTGTLQIANIVTHDRDVARSTQRQISMLDGEVVADEVQATSRVIGP